MLKKILVRGIACLLALLAFGFWLMFFSARPPLATDPATLAGDGSVINYCELPVLDSSGLRSTDIPKGNTPACGYSHFPLPILAQCTEPLVDGADDIRGLWLAVDGGKDGHVERIEQCGSRVVVTTAGIIHDGGPNSSGGLNSNDTEGSVLFTLGDKEYCPRTSASMDWNDGVLEFRAFGWGPIVVKRYLDGSQLVWEYADGSVTRMDRICSLPDNKIIPTPRGRHIRVF
jgi:hypothetical protein